MLSANGAAAAAATFRYSSTVELNAKVRRPPSGCCRQRLLCCFRRRRRWMFCFQLHEQESIKTARESLCRASPMAGKSSTRKRLKRSMVDSSSHHRLDLSSLSPVDNSGSSTSGPYSQLGSHINEAVMLVVAVQKCARKTALVLVCH